MVTVGRGWARIPAVLLAVVFGIGVDDAPAEAQSGTTPQLVYGESMGPQGLNPYTAPGGLTLPARRVLSTIYEPLFRFDYAAGQANAWIPVLADGSQTLAGPSVDSVFTVRLKEGVTWHDGRPFTADDVVFTYRYMLEGPVSDQLKKQWQEILRGPPRKTGPLEIVFEFRTATPDPRFFMLDPILPAHRFDERFGPRGDDIVHSPLGTGPFQFVEWKDQFPLLRRYERHHAKPDGNLTAYMGRQYTDATTMANTFVQSDALHLLVEVPTDHLAEIQGLSASGDVTLDQLDTYNVYVVALRQREGNPFDNDRVRRAVTMAVNRELMLKNYWRGNGEVLASPFSSAANYFDPSVQPLPYDPNEAKSELELALGGSMRRPLRFVYPRGMASFDTRVQNAVQMIKEQLEAVGLRINDEPLDPGVYDETVFRNRDFDLAWMQWRFNPAYAVRAFFHSEETVSGGSNVMNLRNPRVDSMLDSYDAATDPNTARRRRADLSLALNQLAPAIFLLSEKQLYSYKSRFSLPPTKVDPFDFFPFAADWRWSLGR